MTASANPSDASEVGNPTPVRALRSISEFEACVELQKRVWGFDDSDLVPMRMFVVARKIGGQIFGAYTAAPERASGEELVGYALAMPGDRNGHLYLHSHMLAVAPEHRDHGVGRWLKLRQREDALTRGLALMEWTFDPLEIKNAYFNLRRLGAIARRYVPNLYGMMSSALTGALPTDRLVAEWWLSSRRVKGLLQDNPAPVRIEQRVEVPAEIAVWKARSDPRAAQTQTRIREALQAAFAAGLMVLDYERGNAGDGVFLLGREDEEDWNYGPPHTEF